MVLKLLHNYLPLDSSNILCMQFFIHIKLQIFIRTIPYARFKLRVCVRVSEGKRAWHSHVHGMPSIFGVKKAAAMGANAKNPQLH